MSRSCGGPVAMFDGSITISPLWMVFRHFLHHGCLTKIATMNNSKKGIKKGRNDFPTEAGFFPYYIYFFGEPDYFWGNRSMFLLGNYFA